MNILTNIQTLPDEKKYFSGQRSFFQFSHNSLESKHSIQECFFPEQLPWRGTSRRPSDHEITFGSDPDNIFEQELREKVWGGKFPFLVVVRNWVCDRSVREQSVVGDSEPGSHEILPTCQRNPTCWSREIRPTCQKQRAVQRNPCNANCKHQKSTQPAAIRSSTSHR